MLAGCKGNKYVTTIHVINSCIVKTSKLTKVGKVYRGVKGGKLPKQMTQEDALGVRGGVEQAFQSTTRERDVAMKYVARGKTPILFEIEMGMVDRGCELSWISQYPHEEEVLFAPLTGLQLMRMHVDGSVLVRLPLTGCLPVKRAAGRPLAACRWRRCG